jgi:uncharacterized protein YeaO (DUF488 family)
MVVRLKRVYEPPEEADGTRVLVERLWPRGLARDRARIDLWLKDIAPSPSLRRWFHHDPARWTEFQRRYREELAGREPLVAQLLDLASHGDVTLVFAARDLQHNSARVLQEYLEQRLGPSRRR